MWKPSGLKIDMNPIANGSKPKVALNWRELYEYKDLFFFLVWRDIKVLYAQTVLGFGWAILRPVFTMLVFSLVFGRLANMPSDGLPYPLFAYAGLLPWLYFSTAFTRSAESLLSNAKLLSKIYFPRIIIPFTPVLAGLVDFAISSLVLVCLMAWYGVYPDANIVLFPLLVLLMLITSVGMGLWLSALAIQYRDIRHANQFLSQLLMYTAPVVWPASLIAENFPEYSQVIRSIYGLYPMAGVIEGFRSVLLGSGSVPWDLIISGSFSAILILLTGIVYFRKKEKIFADVA